MILATNKYKNQIAEPVIGRNYHLSWAKKRGMVWKLIAINGDVCTMETPKTKKRLTTKSDALRNTNKTIVKHIVRAK